VDLGYVAPELIDQLLQVHRPSSRKRRRGIAYT
jgi:hypothetical protein